MNTPARKDDKQHRVKITADEIEIVLDHLARGLTEAKYKKDPKRADAVYEAYQTFGQALGENNIVLEFEEAPDSPQASQPSVGKQDLSRATPGDKVESEIDKILATLQHRTSAYSQSTVHDYTWEKRTPDVGDEGYLCSCGFHVRQEWLDEARNQILTHLKSAEKAGREEWVICTDFLAKGGTVVVRGFVDQNAALACRSLVEAHDPKHRTFAVDRLTALRREKDE